MFITKMLTVFKIRTRNKNYVVKEKNFKLTFNLITNNIIKYVKQRID